MMHIKRHQTILIIEDNPGDFALVEEYLFEQIEAPLITHVCNYQEARNLLNEGKTIFDIILLDLSLPDKTGVPLIELIVEMSSKTPVIVLTGYADFNFGVKSLSLGISDYLLKDGLTSSSLYKSIVYNLERKRITSELEESEKKYSQLFHLSPLPMYVFELETFNFLDANDAFIKYYGYSIQEILMMNLKQIRPDEEIPAFEEDARKDNDDCSINSHGIYKHIKKNGEIIQVDIRSNIIEYKGRKARITIANDVTERLTYIKAIEKQNIQLKEIAWIQSHVVRAPLAKIMGLVEVIGDLKDNEKERSIALNFLLSSANELDSVIRNITDRTSTD
jgi:PAS domain S-box-containing protein